MSTDIGENCIDCNQSVKWGSGFYVNRIPADNGIVDGYLCSACQAPEDDSDLACEWCSNSIPTGADFRSERGRDILCADCKEADLA